MNPEACPRGTPRGVPNHLNDYNSQLNSCNIHKNQHHEQIGFVKPTWGLLNSSLKTKSATTTLSIRRQRLFNLNSSLDSLNTNPLHDLIRTSSSLRGGASIDEYDDEEEEYDDLDSTEEEEESDSDSDSEQEDSDEDEDDEDEYDEEYDSDYDEYEEEYDEEEEDEEEQELGVSSSIPQVYDEALTLTPMQDMGITLGVMVLCNKLDLTNKNIIRGARYAFIAYVVLMQIFLAYVRYRAHVTNDRTPVTVNNPLSNLVQSQLSSGSNGIVKNLASSFLSSSSTVMEYDLSQAKSTNSRLLPTMLMLWVMHYKMGQVQPLFYQTVNGFKDMLTSPLFQSYVLGRNLERPFGNTNTSDLENEGEGDDDEKSEGDGEEEEEEEVQDEEEEEDEESDDESSEDEEDDSDEESEDDMTDDESDDESDDDSSPSEDEETDDDTSSGDDASDSDEY